MQPDAQSATDPPKGPLAWGQLNFIHTTDTHGWLEGHLKEENYGADFGDFKSFAQVRSPEEGNSSSCMAKQEIANTGMQHMRAQADKLDVDLCVLMPLFLQDQADLCKSHP